MFSYEFTGLLLCTFRSYHLNSRIHSDLVTNSEINRFKNMTHKQICLRLNSKKFLFSFPGQSTKEKLPLTTVILGHMYFFVW